MMMMVMMTLIGNYDIKDSGDSQLQPTKLFVNDLPIEGRVVLDVIIPYILQGCLAQDPKKPLSKLK